MVYIAKCGSAKAITVIVGKHVYVVANSHWWRMFG